VRVFLTLAVASALAWVEMPQALAFDAAQAPVPAAPASPTTPPRSRAPGRTVDDRVALMARELDLSPDQQAQVKKLLLDQREQVLALWNDTTVPPALRVHRTQVITDHTAEQIRALLNDAQREKYIKPRVRETTVGSAGASLEAWMGPLKVK